MRPNESGARHARRRALLCGWIFAAFVIVVRAAQVQLAQASTWQEAADGQHRTTAVIPAPRGAILDRTGTPMVVSQERFRIAVAPHELEDPDDVARVLAETLEVPLGDARRATRSSRPWIRLPGHHPASVYQTVARLRGVYGEREMRRIRPNGALASAVLGTIVDGEGRGGIEQAFDTLLSGRPGREISARDAAGREIPGETWVVEPPRTGAEIVLTIDLDVQEIAYEALSTALESTGARGGDLIVVEPESGEILALVSLAGEDESLSALNAPYEPGSTLKPFTVAGLLKNRLVELTDSVDTGQGHWTVAGRTLRDVGSRARGVVPLSEALKHSSNVGIAKAARALSEEQQFENLRDFGFGIPTGIELPGEGGGLLRHPRAWSAQSPASLAIGYEVAVTPIQMAMAYASLANGGVLLEPRLVREIRRPDGRRARFASRRVRRTVPESVARRIAEVLEQAVDEGTGVAARLATFKVAGKSGTSRAYGPGGYQPGEYYASFVGFFPAAAPQLVIYVKLNSPRGRYYGGSTAAPVTRATMEAILAARQAPIDRAALAAIADPPDPEDPVRFAAVLDAEAGPALLPVPAPPVPVRVDPTGVSVPDLEGVPLRVAARRLHAYGVRVSLEGTGTVRSSVPRPGTRVIAGDTVRLYARP